MFPSRNRCSRAQQLLQISLKSTPNCADSIRNALLRSKASQLQGFKLKLTITGSLRESIKWWTNQLGSAQKSCRRRGSLIRNLNWVRDNHIFQPILKRYQ